jgi:hypothetical protein
VAVSPNDTAGKLWDAHGPIHSARSLEAVARLLALSPRTPTVLDALYANQDEEYLDATALEKALGQAESP